MKKFTSLLFAMMILSFVHAQSWWGGGISGEGDPVTKSMDLGEFSGIVFSLHGDVDVQKGAPSFSVTAQQNIIDNLDLQVKGDVLYIGYKERVKNVKKPIIKIAMPSVHKLMLTGSGKLNAYGFDQAEHLELKLTGSGHLSTDNGGKEMEVSISGSGNISIAGNADKGQFSISGSGNIRAEDLVIQSVSARVSGSGNIDLACKNDVDARISGSGNINVYGNPKIVARVSGSGKVHEH